MSSSQQTHARSSQVKQEGSSPTKTPTASFKKRFLSSIKGKTRDDMVWMLHVIEGELRFMDLLERYDARTVDSVSGQDL